MARRTPETLADYIVVGIAPMLIMTLIGSLVFFLVGVFYQGDFPYRLTWVLGLFVLATVCVARISMEEGAGYAALFGLPLGVVVGIAVVYFVQIEGPLAPFSPLINWGLLGLIWWCAHQLTWDCTLLDDRQDNTGQGLLQSMGWDESAGASGHERAPTSGEANHSAATETASAQARPWWQRILGQKDQPAAHGRWVVYFSIAALPLFGLGQYFIPIADVAGRRYAFWMLVIYVGSGLGLLLTTSFLGLRRYIRQRQLEMPIEMAAVWLSVGIAMILGLLVAAALLPRPAPEYSIAAAVQAKLGSLTSPERSASRIGIGPEGAESDEPHGNSSEAASQTGQPAEKNESVKDQGSSGATQSQPTSNSSSSQANGKSGAAAKSNSQDEGSATGGEKGPSGSSGGDAKSEQADAGQDNGSSVRQDKPADESSDTTNDSRQQGDQAAQGGEQAGKAQSANQSSPPAASPAPSRPQAAPLLSNLGNLLRYAFYAAMALLAAFLAWKYRRELAAAWQQLLKELREWLDWWFGRTNDGNVDGQPQEPTLVLKTFRDYPDPFATGRSGQMSSVQLVQYSFDALQAWGRDFAAARETGQTPHEFGEALALRQPAIDLPARQLAEIYSRMAYARQSPPAQTLAVLQTLWRTMNDVAQRPTAGVQSYSS